MDGDAIEAAFKQNRFQFSDHNVASEVAAVASSFGYDNAKEVSNEYEAFMFQRPKVADVVSGELLEAFRAYLKKRARISGKENRNGQQQPRQGYESAENATTPTKTPGRGAKRKSSMEGFKTPVTLPSGHSPSAKTPGSATSALLQATPSTSFKNRTQRGKVQVQFNGHLQEPLPEAEAASAAHRVPQPLGPTLPANTRYGADTLKSKAMYIESRILNFIEAFAASRGREATYPVGAPSQELVCVAGRIVCDSDGRLNNQSVLLEGSMRYSGGLRVRIDLSKVAPTSLLPGQIVVLEGFNPTGDCFIATELVSCIPETAKFQESRTVRGFTQKRTNSQPPAITYSRAL